MLQPRIAISMIRKANLPSRKGVTKASARLLPDMVIRKETPVPELDYSEHLWQEKEIKSVANITRQDIQEFLPLAAEIPIKSLHQLDYRH
jgi:D-arabinose 1-dehydrogenase-like Zn-dependent alcohol dehydrogenase